MWSCRRIAQENRLVQEEGDKKHNYVCLCAHTYILCVCTCTLVCLSRSQPSQNWCLRGLLHETGSASCPEAELNLLTIFQTDSNCRKPCSLLVFACALLYEGTNFKFCSVLEMIWGDFGVPLSPGEHQSSPVAPSPGSICPDPAARRCFRAFSRAGRCPGCSPGSGWALRGGWAAFPAWASISRPARGQPLSRGPCCLLQSSSTLNASRLRCSQPALPLPTAIWAVPKPLVSPEPVPCPGTTAQTFMGCPGNRAGFKHKRSITWFAFPPFQGPRLGERRAETLNRFVLICFMILLGAVFTQIRQASGLDNLLEISSVWWLSALAWLKPGCQRRVWVLGRQGQQLQESPCSELWAHTTPGGIHPRAPAPMGDFPGGTEGRKSWKNSVQLLLTLGWEGRQGVQGAAGCVFHLTKTSAASTRSVLCPSYLHQGWEQRECRKALLTSYTPFLIFPIWRSICASLPIPAVPHPSKTNIHSFSLIPPPSSTLPLCLDLAPFKLTGILRLG